MQKIANYIYKQYVDSECSADDPASAICLSRDS